MKNDRIPYLKLLPIILIVILFYKSVNSLDVIKKYIDIIIGILVPLIWAMAIAYIIHPLVSFIETKANRSRNFSIFIVYIVLTGIIAAFAIVVIPRIVVSITELIEGLPRFIVNLEVYLTKWLHRLTEYSFSKYIEFETVNEYISRISGIFDKVIFTALNSILGVSTGIFKFIIGFVISIYILKDKEAFGKGFRKFFYAKFTKENADKILEFFKDSDIIFSRYIVGKLIDSIIIGIIALLGFAILKTPYPMLLALIIGITNMIPYFGPFIGAVPVVIITLFFNPMLALWVAVFIFLLQQLDAYVIGPKILGKSLGLSPFWIVIAILIGGGLFGIIGMLIGVPIMAIIRNMVIKHIDSELIKKELLIK
jgi:predicted PurR-regulated permease PerM